MAVEQFFIIVNSSGSDTAASGCGPATAVSGTGASVTSGSTSVDVSADSPDLSSVVADDLLWVDTTSGRQWGRIASVDNVAKTVTLTTNNTYTVTETGRNWGIGGKRATLMGCDNFMLHRRNSSYVGDMAYYGISIEDNQTITSKFPSADVSHAVHFVMKGSGATRPVITCSQTAGTPALRTGWSNADAFTLMNLEFNHTNNASTDEFISKWYNSTVRAFNCRFGSAGDANAFLEDQSGSVFMVNCEVHCSTFSAYELTSGTYELRGCSIFGTGSGTCFNSRISMTLDSCVVVDFAQAISNYSSIGAKCITNCIFDNITTAVFYDTSNSDDNFFYANHNNCYSNCGEVYKYPTRTYERAHQVAYQFDGPIERRNNNYYNVTTVGATLNSTETQLDPAYADTANNDYTITNATLLTGGGYPISLGGHASTSSVGPTTSSASGGGSSTPAAAVRHTRLK